MSEENNASGKSGKLFNFIPSTQGGASIEDLFTKKPEEETSNGVMESLIKTEGQMVEQKKSSSSILGDLPQIEESLLIDQEFHMKQKLVHLRSAFILTCVAFFLALAFFTMALTPSFDLFNGYIGENTGKKLENLNTEMKNLQTEVNADRYRIAKEYIDQFAYDADLYEQKYLSLASLSESEKPKVRNEMDAIKNRLSDEFSSFVKYLNVQNYAPLFTTAELSPSDAESAFDGYLVAYLEQQKTVFKGDPVEVRKLDEIIRIVGNTQFEALLSDSNFSAKTAEQMHVFLDNFFQRVTHPLALLHRIKTTRIDWTPILLEVDRVTIDLKIKGDPALENAAGVVYTSYDFDGVSGRLTLSGTTKTQDATNFNMVSLLIDGMEASSLFRKVDMRSFSKSGSKESGYTGSFKIDLYLQPAGTIDLFDRKFTLDIPLFIQNTPEPEVVPKPTPQVKTPPSEEPTL